MSIGHVQYILMSFSTYLKYFSCAVSSNANLVFPSTNFFEDLFRLQNVVIFMCWLRFRDSRV